MTNAQSKFPIVTVPCNMYVHPWTDNCWNSVAGLIFQSFEHSAKVYTAVYMLSLLMRGRIPTQKDLKNTFYGILQSTGFLMTNSFTYLMYACFFRYWLNGFYYWSVAFGPAFMASLTAILMERPTRRPLLCLYVANLATETLWRMATWRGLVRPIPYGQTIIFGSSTAILMYFYRLGLHKTSAKDSIFKICSFVIGHDEEGDCKEEYNAKINNILNPPIISNEQVRSDTLNKRKNFGQILYVVKIYSDFMKKLKSLPRHKSCPHKNSCAYYSLSGGFKLFGVGVGIQVALKLALQLRKIIQNKLQLRKLLLNKSTLKLGLFLGGFSFLFKSSSCTLRHIANCDHPMLAIPASMIASCAFSNYPDTTIALYVLWKMLQITYNIGIEKGIVPRIPGFTIFLYSVSTATLFHAAALEPQNLRPSYWKFLSSISGGRVLHMDRRPFEGWGFDSHRHAQEVMKLTGTDNTPVNYAFS